MIQQEKKDGYTGARKRGAFSLSLSLSLSCVCACMCVLAVCAQCVRMRCVRVMHVCVNVHIHGTAVRSGFTYTQL